MEALKKMSDALMKLSQNLAENSELFETVVFYYGFNLEHASDEEETYKQ